MTNMLNGLLDWIYRSWQKIQMLTFSTGLVVWVRLTSATRKLQQQLLKSSKRHKLTLPFLDQKNGVQVTQRGALATNTCGR